MDADSNVLANWLEWPFGVDAKGALWKRHKRTDREFTAFGADVATRAFRIELLCSHMPKERWNDIIAEGRAKYEDVKKLVDDYGVPG